mmetsp:Transcript_24048/g.51929  ORF Transcript_24048/g.51929 Transcript_24048/m.51929 type:complete len:253 (-) Transcript_24048:459-1217(-)
MTFLPKWAIILVKLPRKYPKTWQHGWVSMGIGETDAQKLTEIPMEKDDQQQQFWSQVSKPGISNLERRLADLQSTEGVRNLSRKKRNITPGNAILLKINDEPIGRRMPINSIESMFDEDEKEFSIQFRRAASINHMFTSPAVATTLGLTDVLQHMFENEDVDINEHHRVLDKHLLPRIFSATLLYSSLLSSHNPSFDYLLLRGDIDLSVDWCTRQSNDRNILHVIASGYRQQPGSVSSSTSKGTSPSEFERR